jgi:ornithine carbamoyltransferase
MKRDVITVLDMRDDIEQLIELASRLKRQRGSHEKPLENKTLAMIFEKSSTRTRVSFEVAMNELGGRGMYLSSNDMQIGRGETISDTAKVLSRFVHGIMYRAFRNDMMKELAAAATVPVINGLDDLEHPCQILADLLTVQENFQRLQGLKMVYLGDGNNVCNSLMLGAALTGMDMVACCPEARMPDAEVLKQAQTVASTKGCRISLDSDPLRACQGAHVLYTDVWVSMGDEMSLQEAMDLFSEYQINQRLLDVADPSCIVMHCLPAHRGEEISAEVIDGPQSVVFDQAENRLHAQKAILWNLLR